jgi:hypothetical protein
MYFNAGTFLFFLNSTYDFLQSPSFYLFHVTNLAGIHENI